MVSEVKKKKKTSKHRRISADGKVWYYYKKKKKPGPRKKPGPKKKKKTTWVRRIFPPWNFKIIICGNKKQSKYVKRYHNEEEVMIAKNELLEQNKNVVLPAERLNNGRTSDDIQEWNLEYLILKKVDKENYESNISKLPNKYGKYVEHITNNEDWVIWDKFPCLIEEEFWVYGYDKITDRKTVTWIYENLILDKIESKYDILRIALYNNKLVILDDNNHIDLIICKNTSDGIRLYNILSNKFCNKNKNVYFIGRCRRNTELQTKLFNLIQRKTGWNKKDIYRSSTRH